MLVKDVMMKPITIDRGDLATKARAIFKARGVRTVYVTGPNGRLAGALDRDDVINLRSKKSDLSAKDIALRRPVLLSSGMNILDAARMLVDAGNVDAPVVEGGRLLGCVDAVSLVRGFLQKGCLPKSRKVSDFMTKKVVSAASDEPVGKILHKFEEHKSLPVLKGRKLIGILTQTDVLRHGKFSRQKNASVERMMKTPALTVGAGDTAELAAELLVRHDFNALPVVDGGGSLRGIVTRYDLLRAYSKG